MQNASLLKMLMRGRRGDDLDLNAQEDHPKSKFNAIQNATWQGIKRESSASIAALLGAWGAEEVTKRKRTL